MAGPGGDDVPGVAGRHRLLQGPRASPSPPLSLSFLSLSLCAFRQGPHPPVLPPPFFTSSLTLPLRLLPPPSLSVSLRLMRGCPQPGEKYSDIGGIIEDIVEAKGYTSVKEFCGHGCVSLSALSLSPFPARYGCCVHVHVAPWLPLSLSVPLAAPHPLLLRLRSSLTPTHPWAAMPSRAPLSLSLLLTRR